MLSFRFASLALALVAGATAAPIQRRDNSGQATFFQAGLGACGWTNSGSDMIVAVTPSVFSGGSVCGKKITITNEKTGKTQEATISDECPTCTSTKDLDMSSGLFSALGGTEEEGVFQMKWSWGSDSSSSSSSSSSSNSNDSKDTNQKSTKTSSSSAAKSSSSSSASDTVSGTPSWWSEVQDYCNLDSKPEYPVAIAPSKFFSADDLSNACGKSVSLKNPANGKTVTGTVASYLSGAEENSIALSNAYSALADDASNPGSISTVQWGIAN